MNFLVFAYFLNYIFFEFCGNHKVYYIIISFEATDIANKYSFWKFGPVLRFDKIFINVDVFLCKVYYFVYSKSRINGTLLLCFISRIKCLLFKADLLFASKNWSIIALICLNQRGKYISISNWRIQIVCFLLLAVCLGFNLISAGSIFLSVLCCILINN